MLSGACRYSIAAAMHGAGGGFPPLASMAAWFRKGTGITQSANAVSQWNDQSGNGRNLTQATGAAQPTLQGTGTVLFNGTSHFMTATAFGLAQPLTVYMRVKQVTWVGGHYFLDGTTLNKMVIFQPSGDVTPQIALFDGTQAADNSGLPVNTFGTVAAVFAGAGSSLQTPGAKTTGNPGSAAPGGITVAAPAGGANLWGNIELAEMIVYSVAHSVAQQAKTIAYMNTVI